MKCKLTTITPCHIGSGNTLNRNVDFVSEGGYIGVVDSHKIFKIVGEQGIAGWCSAIDRRDNILDYVRGVRPSAQLKDICSRLLEIQGANEIVTGLREHISTMGIPYIPGSSIKGAVVSAILASITPKVPDTIKIRGNKIVDTSFSAREESNGNVKYDPKSSVLRFLRVGDALFDGIPTMAVYCNMLNVRNSKEYLTDNSKSQYIEAIYTDEPAIIEFHIMTKEMNRVREEGAPLGGIPEAMRSPQDLLKCINTHTLTLLRQEKDGWKGYDYSELDDYMTEIDSLIAECESCEAGHSAILRLGYGVGWDFITGNWCKELATDEEWDGIVRLSRPNNDQCYSEYMFPKTRRTFAGYQPLGFVKIELCK